MMRRSRFYWAVLLGDEFKEAVSPATEWLGDEIKSGDERTLELHLGKEESS